MSASLGRKATQPGGSFGTIRSRPNGLEAIEASISNESMKLLDEFREQMMKAEKGLPSTFDLTALPAIIDVIRHSNAIDDRKLLLEHVLVFLSQRPPGPLATSLQNAAIELLYNDLPHPPSTYVGQEYSWRKADGSGNNISDPNMGKAHTPYARSVQQLHALPHSDLPDPGLVFDTLLRREKFTKHPAGLSSMMFAFAALVIHTVFRTSHENVNINETSSYIDLAPLYGCNQEAQDRVRARNGRGYLRPDTFTEDRLLLLPPAVPALLILFNRNHNYIAKKLLEINERGTYVDPDSIPASDPQRSNKLLAQEEDIFQTARLINCGWFGSAVFSDYFSAILGLVRQGSKWSLDPFTEIREWDHSLFERGQGNVCSVEFNCLYRWHATTSAPDEKWVEDLIERLFKKSPDEVTMEDMKLMGKEMEKDDNKVTHWTIGNLQRQDDGTFKDEDLANILYQATENPAHAFGAKSTPGCMRLHEIMGIMQSRQWGTCSLNDFRQFLGLKTYASFSEWNNDPEVAAAAEKLYGHIDRLELYAGLQAEQPKPKVEGAGLCPPYTISRAILADAIALTRGDRLFTADYTPFNLTAWGFADCQRDPNAPGYGSTLGRLLLRGLPNHYAPDSSYTWFPLMTPDAMQPILTNLGTIDLYDFSKPSVTSNVPEVSSYRDAGQVLGSDTFNVPYTGRAAHVIKGDGFFIAPSDPSHGQREQRNMLGALTGAPGALDKIAGTFYQKTRELMISQSWGCVGQQLRNVDVVRDVLKYVPLYWASEVAGIKLKNKPSDDGVYTPQELYDILTEIYSFLFLDFDHWKFLPLSAKVREYIDELLGHIKSRYGRTSRLSIINIFNTFSRILNGTDSTAEDALTARFAALGYDNDTLANSILAVLVGSTVEMSEGLVNAVNFYLEDPSAAQLKTCVAKGKLDAQDQAVMQGLVLEALRLNPSFRGVYREALTTENVGTCSLEPHDHVFVDIATASLDPDVFPNPKSVNPNRSPRERYLVGDGVTKCLGLDVSSRLMAEVLRGVFSFSNVRRAPGRSGLLKCFKTDAMKTSSLMYLDKEEKPSPWATSMVIQYD